MAFSIPTEIMGVPTWAIVLIIIGVGAVVYFTNRKKEEEFKRVPLKTQIKDDLDTITKVASEVVGGQLHLKLGLVSVGYVQSSTPITWYAKATHIENTKRNALKVQDAKAIEKAEQEIKTKNEKELRKCHVIKYYGYGKLDYLLSLLGYGIKYIIVDDELLKINTNEIVIDHRATPETLLGITMFGVGGIVKVKNTSYKIAFENVLDELTNSMPKQTYLEERIASNTAKLREIAKIEKDKYKAQISGAGGGSSDEESD